MFKEYKCKSSVYVLRVRFLNFPLIFANCLKTQVILVSHFVICNFKLVVAFLTKLKLQSILVLF